MNKSIEFTAESLQHFQKANQYQEQQDHEQALAEYNLAVSQQANNPLIYANRANAHFALQDYEQAIADYSQAINIQDNPGFYYNRANAYQALDKDQIAIDDYSKAIELKPDFVDAYFNRGVSYQRLYNTKALTKDELLATQAKQKHKMAAPLDYAIADYSAALKIDPNYIKAYLQRGSCYHQQQEHWRAIDDYNAVIGINPEQASAYYNRGNVYLALNKHEQAVADYDHSVNLRRKSPLAYNNIGQTYYAQNDRDKAIVYYEKAIANDPDCLLAKYNLSMALLGSADFKRGWPAYECRFEKVPDLYDRKVFPDDKRWRGENLKNKTIVLLPEQGAGDNLQFLRFGELIQGQGANVILVLPDHLLSLGQALTWPDNVISKVELPADLSFDYHVTLVSAAQYFQHDIASIPNNIPYLKTSGHTAVDLSHINTPKIGIVWAGNPKHHNDKNRSLEVKHFMALQNSLELKFYSLQKGQSHDLSLKLAFFDFTDLLNNYMDTALLIEQLDLVISVDTSVAHLAAALGKPTWLLLPYVPDWRWLLDRDDSPWYPNMRLFRQPAADDWDSVFAELQQALRLYAQPN